MCVPNFKVLASPVPEIWRGPKIQKYGLHDPFPIQFDLILHLFIIAPCDQYACQI